MAMSAPVSERTKVLFNKPIKILIPGPTPVVEEPAKKTKMTHAEIMQLVNTWQRQGWDDRAIVTRITQWKYEMAAPLNWGVVIDLKRSAPMVGEYIPLVVRWVKDGSISYHWPEDLVLIHESLSQWDMDQRLKEQGVVMR